MVNYILRSLKSLQPFYVDFFLFALPLVSLALTYVLSCKNRVSSSVFSYIGGVPLSGSGLGNDRGVEGHCGMDVNFFGERMSNDCLAAGDIGGDEHYKCKISTFFQTNS